MCSDQDCRCSRREFLRCAGSAVLISGFQRPEAAAPKTLVSRPVVWRSQRRGSPHAEIRLACIGLGQRGSQHVLGFEAVAGAAVVALCDVDRTVLYRQAEEFQQRTGRKLRLEIDYRRLLDDPGIDAVSVATCNHTHALIAAAALQAGKDVYVEKPCSHTFWEGQQLVRAAQKTGRICMHGVQARSSPAVQEAIHWLHGGLIGQVQWVRVRAAAPAGVLPVPDEPPPPGVAYDFWLGPAPLRPFNRARFHRHWRWWPEYGNGPLANHALHLVDLARWGLDVDWPCWIRPVRSAPRGRAALPGIPPEVWQLEFRGPKWICIELWPAGDLLRKASAGWTAGEAVTFYGTEGRMVLSCFGYQTYFGRAEKPGPAAQAASQEFEQFIRAVQTGKLPAAASDALQGHLSSGLVHLVNIARQVGRAVQFDPSSQSILADPEASALCRKQYRTPFLFPQIV